MFNAIKHFFTVPVFPNDEAKTRLTRILYTLVITLISAIVLSLIIAVPFIFVQKLIITIILLTALVLLIIIIVCAKLGNLALASLLYIFMLWMWAAISLYLVTGTSSHTLGLYIAITVTAGILLSVRWAVALAVINSMVVLGFALLEINGYPFPHLFPVPPLSRWFHFSIYLFLTITPIYLILTSLSEALASTQQEIELRKEAELLLRESELLNRSLVESIPQRIFLKDRQSVYLSCNAHYAHDLGIEPEQIVGKDDSDFYPPKLAEKYRADDQTVLETKRLKDIEERYLIDGVERWVHTTKVPYCDAEGHVSGVLGIFEDITDRKLAEEALKENEERFEALANASFEGIVFTDGGVVIDANSQLAQMLRYDLSEIIGKPVADIIAPEDRESVRQNMEAGFEGLYESRLLRKDSSAIVVETQAKHFAYRGRVVRVTAVRDITEKKQAEDALRESEERFSRFFRASPVGTSITRLSDGQFADVNDAFLGLFGFTREEVIGQNPLEREMWASPEDRTKMVEILQEQGGIQDFETRFRRKSGEIMDVLVSAEVIELAGQQYILGLTHDITERKQGERERKKLEEQLFQAQKMESVGRLAGGVAHDFNNMLGVIIGRAEMALEQDVSTDKFQHNLKEILKAALRSADLTRQLLAFARKQTAIPKILDLNDTISGMLKMLRRLIGEDIDLFWIPELDLWNVKIDPSQVDQILANLVVNARDAISGVGAITIRTENFVIDDSYGADSDFIPGEYILLTMSDTGAGMSKEVCENIFEPFFTTKELGKGTGLGLSTVYGIVKQNDGFIYVASEPGKGTTFKIYLPRFEAETAQDPPEKVAGKPPTGTETILVVEDDEAILKLSKMILEELGYTVLAAHTPVEAIRLVEEHPGNLHLLISDVVMPEMNGRELAEQLGAIRPNLKCLYMSGYTADVIAHRGILDEGLNFIQKPFRSDDLAARVRQVLDHLE